MFYGSFGTQNLIVTLIFKFDPRKGQLEVRQGQSPKTPINKQRQGQIRSNFKIQNFLSKVWLSCADFSQDSKNVIYFYVRQLGMPKMHFKNVTSLPLPVFWPLHSQKQRYFFEILYACCLYASQSHIFRFFG